jgi:hypothetical protein
MAASHKDHKQERMIVGHPLIAMFTVKIFTLLFIVEQ